MAEEQELTSVAEAAERLGQTPQHVRRLVRSGALIGHKVGRDWVFLAGSVEQYIAQRENLRLPLGTESR